MKHLPSPVYDKEIDEMFSMADIDQDGRLSYKEFSVNKIK